MKKKKHLTALFLVMIMVVTAALGSTTPQALAGDDTQELPSYNAYEEYSTEANPNGVWSYQHLKNGVYTDLTYDAANNYWGTTDPGRLHTVESDLVTGKAAIAVRPELTTTDTVLTFTAPYSGKINVSMANGGVFAPHNSVDEISFTFKQNDTVVRSVSDLDSAYSNPSSSRFFADTVELTVTEGDELHFIVHRNKQSANPQTYFNPFIEYTELEEELPSYNAYEEYSTEANPNGVWSYQHLKNGVYTNLTYDATNSRWGTTDPGRLHTVESDLVTGKAAIAVRPESTTTDTVLTFTAPYSGKINVSMANGGVFAPHNSVDEISFTFKQNDTVVRSVSDLDSAYSNPSSSRFFADTVELTVTEGDELHFIVHRNKQSANPQTYFNPFIEYTELEEELPSYNAYEEYSTEANPNGVWSYQHLKNGTYTDLTYDAANNYWGTTDPGRLYTVSSDLVTGKAAVAVRPESTTTDTVLTFTAPRSGRVNVSMANGGVFAPHNSVDEISFTFKQNDRVVRSVSDLDNAYNTFGSRFFADVVELTVVQGDELHFIVHRNQQSADPLTYFNPQIVYVPGPRGTTYYISASDGNDSNSGIISAAPWKTFANLENVSLGEDDKILLKAGDTFTECLVLNKVQGTGAYPVRIGAYGDVETAGKPVIDPGIEDDPETAKIETAAPCIRLNDAEGVEIDGLKITGSGVGIHLAYNNTFNHEYVKIKNCEFVDLTGFDVTDYRGQSTRSGGENVTGVYQMATAVCASVSNYNIGVDDPALIGLYLENCTTDNCGTLFANAGSAYEANEGGSCAVSGLYVSGCTMKNNDYYGIYIASVRGGYMTDCLIDTCGDATSFSPGTAGILVSTRDYAIINTEIKNQQRGGCTYDGVGIDLEHLCKNVTVRNCYIHDNTGAGIFIYDSNGGSEHANVNCNVEYNLFENNATEALGSANLLHDDPIADIRITSGKGYAASGCRITENMYYNSNASYVFANKNEKIECDTVIEGNTKLESLMDTYIQDKENVLKEIRETRITTDDYSTSLKKYNCSMYKADVRTGTTEKKAEIIDQIDFAFKDTFGETTTINKASWKPLYYRNGAWTEMVLDGTTWKAATYAIISATAMHPAPYGQTVLAYTAPETGRICISMVENLSIDANTSDGTYITILDKNLQTIAEPIWLKSGADQAFDPVYTNVQAGDRIYFCLSKCESNAGDYTRIQPQISYIYNDVNMDESKSLDVRDIVHMKKMISGAAEQNPDVADYNGDGTVDKTDLKVLYRYILQWWKMEV